MRFFSIIATAATLTSLLPTLAHAEENDAATAPTEKTVVTVQSDTPSTSLYRITGESTGFVATGRGTATVSVTHFERVCSAPCNRSLPTGDRYFVDAPGMTTSRPFELVDASKTALRVKGGNAFLRGLGLWGGLYLGVTGMVAGGTLLLVGAVSSTKSTQDTMVPLGLGITAVGAAALAAGIALIVTNGTDVETAQGQPLAKANTRAPKAAAVRLTPVGLVF